MTLFDVYGTDEARTRGIPYAPWEYAWAHERPLADRVPLPQLGDTVLYRHDPWGPVVEVTVVWMQPLDDFDDPHLWRVETDGMGNPLAAVEGRPIFAQRLDPWPLLRLKVPRLGLGETREARLRGSAGWLPLDWATRTRPAPQFTLIGK